MQVMIINFLGMFFKVQQLSWQEWLFTISIGAGSMLWSLIVRFLSRNVTCSCGGSALTAVSSRLASLNQIKNKRMAASSAVYDAGLELTVQEAVTLARGKATAALEAQAKLDEKTKDRKGTAGTHQERTLSGRSDSAASLH